MAGNAFLTSSDSQTLAAESGGKINAAGYIKAAGAGAATWVDVDNNLTSQNIITTDGKTSLRTDTANGNITLSASDDWAVTAKGVADTQGGAAGGASSDVKNTLQRTNKVDIQGKVYSLNDVNLYAGKDANGVMDNLDLTVESEAYNKTALSVAVPKFKDTLTQANQVVVGKGAEVSSVRHIHAYADEAGKYLREQSVKYTWYHSDAKENFTSTSVGKKSDSINDTTDNYVQIDGKVTAGAQNKQNIVIGGSGQIVVLDNDELAAVKAVKGQEKAVQRPTIDASSGIDTAKITYARIDYANALMARYYELATLISQYSDSKDLTALKGYQDEQTRIYNELNDLGLLSKAIGPDGKEYLVPVSGLTVDTIVLPDIVASGGNIVVEAGSLKGAGALKAQGSPEVTVENHTNLYMKVGDVKAVNPGGEIHYNGQSLAKDAAAVIKSANQDEAAAVNLTVSTDAATSTGGTVTIKSDYGTAAIKAKIDEVDAKGKKTGKKVDAELVPKADIEINGNVEAENGVVTVEDKSYSILLQGEGNRTAEVNGKEIHLTAGKSISQGFTQGIVNIGGNPEELYKDKYFNSEVNEFNKAYGYENTSRVHREDRTHDDVLNGSGSRIAGDNIYINASDINVNGLIQSGYGKYEVTVADAVTSKVQKLDRSWARMGKQDLSDAVITTGTYYLVQPGGKVLQTDGTYKYQPDVYYNPSTQKLVIPDIDAHGGKIYLSGRISSTGNGKIVALDGAYDISVTNPTKTDLQVGKLISNKNDGLISIADSSTNRLTEYTRGSTVVKDLTKWDKTTGDWKVLSTSGASSQYNPQKNLRYNWTSGQKVTTRKHYKHDHKAGLWGAVTTLDETELAKYEQEITPQDMGHNTFTNDNGVYIDTSSLTNKDKQYVFVYDNVVLNNDRTQPVVTKRWKTGFLGWFHWERTEWDTNTGTAQQYVGSVKADHGINIGFLGNQNGNSAINVTSKAGVTLAGKIQSSQSGAGSTITITSQNGAINQNGGLLKGDNIELSAKNGLTNIAIESLGDTVKLDAANTGSGNMNITVDGAYGKAGHVDLVQAKNTNGDVSLTVLGNLTQNGTAVAVEGHRIDLVSRQGSIGTDTAALKVKTPDTAVDALNPLSSSVNVTAKGNIHLAEDSDMRVGIIKSTDSDVKLDATGSIIDVLPSGDTIDRGNTANLIQGWKDLGLIEGDGQYKQKQAEDVAEYKAGVQSEFAQYLKLKSVYEKDEEAAKTDANYQVLKDRYGDYTSADDYLAESDTAKNHLADLQKAGAGWTENELLYAISDAIVNKQQGSTDTELKQANISGQNITLHAKNIGSDKAAEDVLVKGITTDERLDDLKKVVNANVSDVGYTKNDKGENVFRIYGKVPVGIEARGELNVQSDGNIYVAGRTSSENKDTVLKLGKVTTSTGDIRVLGKAGVTNSLTDGSANLKGKNLILEGGSADIGAAGKPIDVDLTGSLSALTDGSMYISSVGNNNLKLTGLYAGKDMVLDSAKDILMSPDASAQAYLNAGRLLDLKAEGSIGAKDSGVRILGNGATINAEAKDGNIYLAGKSKAGEQDGLLLLGTVKTSPGHTIAVTAETSLSLGNDEEASMLVGQVQADTVNLSSDREIDLKNGNLTAVTLKLKAGGSINQTAAHAITAKMVSVDSASGISLDSGAGLADNPKFNDFQTVTVKNGSDATDVTIGSGGSQDLAVSFTDGSKAQNVTVRNYENGAVNNLTVNGPVTAAGGISLVNDEADLKTMGTLTVDSGRLHEQAVGALENEDSLTGDDIILNSTKGMINKSLIATHKVELTAANDILNQGIVQAGTSVSMKSDTGSITNKGDVEAKGGDVTMDAKNDLHNQGVVKASQDAELTSGGSMANEQAVTAGRNLKMKAGTMLTNSGGLTATNGSIELTAQKELLNQGAIQAGTTVTMTSVASSITNNGDVEAKDGNVAMDAKTDLQNKGAVTGSQSVELKSGGSMANDKAVTAGTSVTMTSAASSITNKGDVEAKDGNVTMDAKTDLQNQGAVTGSQSVNLKSDTGSITNQADVEAKDGDVTMDAKADLQNQGAVTAQQDVRMTSVASSITNNGDVEAKDGNVTMDAKTDLGNQGAVTASQSVGLKSGGSMANDKAVTAGTSVTMISAGSSITNKGDVEAKGGDVTMDAKTDLGNQGAVTASQSVGLKSGGSMANDKAVTAGTSVTMKSDTGSITNKGDVEAKGEDVTMDAKNDLHNQGVVKANQDAELTSGGSMANEQAVTAGQNLTMDAGTTLTNGGDLTAIDGSIELTAQKGLRQNGNATAGSSITMDNQQDGDLVVTGDIQSGTSATIKNQNGDVTIDGQVEAKTGDATVKTGSGDVLVKGKLDAGSDATLQSDNGSVTMGGNVQAGRDLQASTRNDGMVFQGNVGSGRDLIAATSQGDITFDGRVEAGRNLDVRTRQEGTITLRQDVTGGANLQFATNDGSIRFEGNDPQKSEDIHVISKDGDVSMTITGKGNMEDSHRQTGGDRAVVEAGSGSITLRHTGVGDVDLYSLLAGKKAGVEVEDGSLYLDTINGDLIAVYVKNPQKTATIEHMEAGSRLSLSGSTIHVAEISQRPGASSSLTLDVDGADQAAPVESLTIGDIKAANGVRIPHLWVRNGAVKTSQGTLQLDKLFVLDKATFSNGTMITDVFGTTPRTDERVHSVYWINTKLGRPQENLSQWLAEAGRGGRWMYLLFDRQGHTQFSNGNLVDLDPHNYVYNQRYSETNWTRTMEDRDFSNFWTPCFHPELTYSSRYDLVDGSQAVSQPANGEITVEEV